MYSDTVSGAGVSKFLILYAFMAIEVLLLLANDLIPLVCFYFNVICLPSLADLRVLA